LLLSNESVHAFCLMCLLLTRLLMHLTFINSSLLMLFSLRMRLSVRLLNKAFCLAVGLGLLCIWVGGCACLAKRGTAGCLASSPAWRL
jgi:hypothetical protein